MIGTKNKIIIFLSIALCMGSVVKRIVHVYKKFTLQELIKYEKNR